MNFLNRQMFQDGRDVNQEFITIASGRTIPVDVNEFKNQVANLTDSEVFALTKDVIAGNRQASSGVTQILNEEASFRDVPFFPGQYSFGAHYDDTLRVAPKVLGPVVRSIFGTTTSERTRDALPQGLENIGIGGNIKNITEYDSDLFDTSMSNLKDKRNLNIPSYKNLPYPFTEQAAETLFTRGGRSSEELDSVIRNLLNVTDEVDSLAGPIKQEPSVTNEDVDTSLAQEVMPEIVGLDLDLYSTQDQNFLEENPGITPEEVGFRPINYRDEFGELAPITAPSMSDFNPFEDNINLTEISQDLDSLSEDRESLQRKQDVQSRRAAYEQSMVGKDEFGFPVKKPERSSSISDFTAELAALKPVNVLKTEEDSKMEIEEKFLPTLPDIDLTITQAEADQINEEELQDPVTKKLNEPGFFGSNVFLDFLRNVGGELTRTGDMAQGLASGAAKAAEERAARELLADQEERKYNKEMELAVAKAKATADAAGSDLVMKPKDIRDLNTDLKTNMSDLEGGVAATGFVDLAIETLKEAMESGESVGGFFGAMKGFQDELLAFVGKESSFENQSAQTKINKLVEVVRQKNLQAILGESGRTISDKDRAIILKVFGDLNMKEDASITLGKLVASRQSLAQNNIKLKGLIEDDTAFMFTQGALGQGFGGKLLPDYQRVLQIDPLASQAAAILAQFMGETGYGGNIQEVDL